MIKKIMQWYKNRNIERCRCSNMIPHFVGNKEFHPDGLTKYPKYIQEKIIEDHIKCDVCHIQPVIKETNMGEKLCAQC